MGSVAPEPASGRSHAKLAALFTAGYEGYYMPVSIDETTFTFMARAWGYDLAGSLVATDADVDVGLCLLAVRDEDAWIGGVGVIAGHRGEGIGEQLMRAAEEQARARGVRRLWLEMLVQNAPAIALYEKLGYERVRALEIWSLDEELVFQKHKVFSIAVSLPANTTGIRYLNGPEGDPLNAVLKSLGGTQVARQHEMVLEL